jgi:hypothetical protein
VEPSFGISIVHFLPTLPKKSQFRLTPLLLTPKVIPMMIGIIQESRRSPGEEALEAGPHSGGDGRSVFIRGLDRYQTSFSDHFRVIQTYSDQK